MGDWNNPVLATEYVDFLGHLKDRDLDAATLFVNAPTNPSESMMRYVRASNKFQEYLSGVWTDKVLSIVGGGTGAANAGDARTNLGLGSISTQNANNVAITGGAITGINFAASVITSGNLAVARLPLGGTWTLTSLLALSGHALHAAGLGAAYRTGAGTTLTDTDFLYECTGGTIILPDCTTITGRIYLVKRSGTTVTFDPTGVQVININGADSSTYAGLGPNQTLILQSNGTKWIAITMGGTVFRDNQFVTVTIGASNSVENQALGATVNEVLKAEIIAITGLVRVITSNNTISVTAHFADSGGSEITSGPATHIKCLGGDVNSPSEVYKFIIVERE